MEKLNIEQLSIEIVDYRSVICKIRNNLESYIKTNSIKALIVGVSGGVDSALCCALAAPVCEKIGVKLIGRSLPTVYNKKEEIQRARHVGETLCTNFGENFQLYDTFLSFPSEDQFKGDILDQKIRSGNIQARLRMIFLYDLAKFHNGIVLSTDNLTEYFLGFWTLHGDVGDYGMIQSLWKTEVYKMSEFLVEEEHIHSLKYCVDAIPTDGLGISNSDLDQLKAKDYFDVDHILKSYILQGCDDFKDHPIIQRYKNSNFKRHNPVNLKRENILI